MFGLCPECGEDPVMLNVGRTHWAVCKENKVRWQVGSNLFSTWLHEDEETWRANSELLEECEMVKPIFLPEDVADERLGEIVASWEDEE